MPSVKKDYPPGLKPFISHGLDPNPNGTHATCRCPFCGRDNKFSIDVQSGLWRCFVCNEGTDNGRVIQGGNPITFLRRLHALGVEGTKTSDLTVLARMRGLTSAKTLGIWGVCRSPVTGDWMMPGYDPHGGLSQLYRWYQDRDGENQTRPTSGLGVQLYGMHLYDAEKPTVWVAEGIWDAMALWEVLGAIKQSDDGVISATSVESQSLRSVGNVLAVPGCMTFLADWGRVVAGKRVIICFDSDYPGERDTPNGKVPLPPSGWNGAKRIATVMASLDRPPMEISVVRWGIDGYDPDLPDGYDLRDFFAGCKTIGDRARKFPELVDKIEVMPEEWKTEARARTPSKKIEPVDCRDFATLVNAWQKALAWSGSHGECLEAVFSTMLAVAISTMQRGDQLFLQVVAAAGSAKSKLCDAMLVSDHCHALEHLTGFHSGYVDSTGEDFSLLARANHKTWITAEGDLLLSSPRFNEIMSQQRRIFDGTSSASFKNRKEDQQYTGLRTPWIMAITPAMLDGGQSRLGDRFLKVMITEPGADDRRNILARAFYSALDEVAAESNCSASSTVSGDMLRAYQLTGGYINYLRANSTRLINQVAVDPSLEERFGNMAEFVAALRARPQMDLRKHTEGHDSPELPSRLVKQLTRLARCLGAVLNKKEVDADIINKVRKVARDTAFGQTMEICRMLRREDKGGKTLEGIKTERGRAEATGTLVAFLARHRVISEFKVPPNNGRRYRLSERFRRLWDEVVGG